MEKILSDSTFQRTLADIAAQKGKSIKSINEEAREYLTELYTAHNPMANMLGAEFAQYVLSRAYDKTIDVKPTEIKKIAKLSRKHPIAFVMTHKTYIDMLVLGLVMLRHGMPLPHIFAGINMSFMGVSQLGRNNGVIFIRRSFKDNLVYKATLRHYISTLVNQKSHFMWAIEGTRSRTGKLVWPKMGILKYIMDAEKDSKQEVKYVPVSIVYDLIPDVNEMTKEGRGKEKKAESLAWFIDYVKKMGDKFGKISLRFGDPVQVTDKSVGLIPEQDGNPLIEESRLSLFAFELVHRINQITPVTTTSLICISLLGKFALSKKAITSDLATIMKFIESYKPEALVDRGMPIGESTQVGINLLQKAGLIQQQGVRKRAKYMINYEHFMATTYYANMAVHHLYQHAFIELALTKLQKVPVENRIFTFWEDIMHLRDVFKFEFFYSGKPQFSDEIESVLNYIDKDWAEHFNNPDTDVLEILKEQTVLVAPVILNTYVEAYIVVAYTLLEWNENIVFEQEDFIAQCLFRGQELQWQGHIQRLESVSKPFLINGIRLAKNRGLIPENGKKGAKSIEDFIVELRDISFRIRKIQEILLSKPNDTEIDIPIERDIIPGSRTEGITKEIMESEGGAHIGAFFDLDRTLIKNFSAKEFVQARLLSGKSTTREIVAQVAGVFVYAIGDGNFAGLAALSVKGVKGVKEEVFIELGEEVYRKHLASEIYPESRALVAAHMAKGHTVAIISAATPYQVNPIARDLAIEHIMCTRMEVKNGKFTGNVIEPACWGDGKAYAAKELVKQFDLDLSKSYFYTDSAEDMPLMEIVGKPRPMNPDTKLAAIAFKRDWPVYRFNDEVRPGLGGMMRTGLALGSLLPAVFNSVISGTSNSSWSEGINALMSNTGDLVTKMAGIELVVHNEEYLWSHRPAVFIFNHQSNVDLFIVSKLIRKNATAIAKKELKYYPVIGQLMQAAGVIFIDRGNREKAIEAMQPAVDALKSGTSLIIFPEGTRSYSYELGKFKKGAFHLAMQAGVPIVPVVIRNAHDVMPRGTNVFRPSAVEVKVLKPVSTKRWTPENMDGHIDKIRKRYLKELGQKDNIQKQLPSKSKASQNGVHSKSKTKK